MEDDQQGQADDIHVVNILPLAEELREQLAINHSSEEQLGGGSPSCPITIAEVGRLTRNVDAAMYDPHHISIGPYHLLRNPDLVRDAEKIRSLEAILSAASGGTVLEEYVDELERLEGDARRCYAHSFPEITSRVFVRMLLLDGCYLLAQFGRIGGGGRRSHAGADMANGHVEGGTLLAPAAPSGDRLETLAVVRDVFYLAENQIPLFILDKILQINVSDPSAHAADWILWFVQAILQTYSVASLPSPRPGNLLHLLHMHLQPTNPPSSDTAGDTTGGKKLGRWRTATEYYFVGVTLKPRPLDGAVGTVRSVLDVHLDSGGGTLEIPPLIIDAETWRLLHNLMALEQRNPGPAAAGSHVTAYCVFMSQLACTAADVDLLSSKGIIAHALGNNGEVASRFADLCKGILFSLDDPRGNYLRGTCQALEERFQSRARQWMAWLGRKYFDNPWLFIGLLAAAVGLSLYRRASSVCCFV
ncbi:hypothetical protein SEVIR_6G131800v4 [Setaria viridis]|uniref:Uncharacterized protein n=1 Tax=Setaria viridis TaxID=4556 RepID=A0A4U6U636_SETVI|nr:hypothetical protein SEVIR_6G131800v2 [Setaria viridis]